MYTLGWDTVFAIDLASANAELAKDQGLARLSWSSPPQYHLEANCGPWQLEPTGSGQLIHLVVPFTGGTLLKDSTSIDLSGLAVVVEVGLNFVAAASAPQQSELRLAMRTKDSGGQPGPGKLTPIGVRDPENRLDNVAKALLLGSVADVLVSRQESVNHIFATVGLVEAGGGGWLQPVINDYAFIVAGNRACLALMALTTHRSDSGLPRQLDPDITPLPNSGTFVVSAEMFLTHVIMPALPGIYGHGTDASTFAFANGAIHNTRQIDTDSVKSGAIWYYPKIDQLSVSIAGNALQTSIRGSCDLNLGIWMTFTLEIRNQAVFDPAHSTISFQPDPNPSSSHDADIPWYYKWLAFVVGLVTSAVVNVISRSIEDSLRGMSGQLSVAASPPQSVHFAGMKPFSAVSAGLDHDFFVTAAFGGTTPGLLGYWPFREDGSDQSGNGRNAQLVEGARIVANARGRVGALALVPGAYVRIPRVDISKTDFTVACWVNVTSTANRNVLFGDWVSLWQFLFAVSAGGAVAANLRKNTNDFSGSNPNHDLVILSSTGRVPAGQWCHIAITWDRTARQCTAYINGVPAGSATTSPPNYPNLDLQQNAHDHYCIGHKEDGSDPSAWFNGSLSDFRIYSRALAPDELQTLQNT